MSWVVSQERGGVRDGPRNLPLGPTVVMHLEERHLTISVPPSRPNLLGNNLCHGSLGEGEQPKPIKGTVERSAIIKARVRERKGCHLHVNWWGLDWQQPPAQNNQTA